MFGSMAQLKFGTWCFMTWNMVFHDHFSVFPLRGGSRVCRLVVRFWVQNGRVTGVGLGINWKFVQDFLEFVLCERGTWEVCGGGS